MQYLGKVKHNNLMCVIFGEKFMKVSYVFQKTSKLVCGYL
jgi:hypothetical protein